MFLLSAITNRVADAGSAATIMHAYVAPVVQTMCVVAALVCVLFLIIGGIRYITSSGRPDQLAAAKLIIRNAILGLVLVLAAGTITTLLNHAFYQSTAPINTKLPSLASITPKSDAGGLIGVIIKAITGIINDIVQTAALPFLKALAYFTKSTPLISGNSSVFNMWLAVVGMTDVLFMLAVALLGFHVMGFASFGLEELEFKQLLPQLALVFVLINSSAFIIDGFISLSNVMIHALRAGFSSASVWNVLTVVTTHQSGAYGLAALLIMLAFLIFAVILVVYYVGRIVTIYIGAVLSPILFLLWIIPGFKGFAETAAKVYLATIFVLFIHVVILTLSASLFTGLIAGSPTHSPDPLMSLVIGIATLIALLKTQGLMMQLSYAGMSWRAARKLGSQFITGVSYMANHRNELQTALSSGISGSRSLASFSLGRLAPPFAAAQQTVTAIPAKLKTVTATPPASRPLNARSRATAKTNAAKLKTVKKGPKKS